METAQLFDYVIDRQFKGFVTILDDEDDARLMAFACSQPNRWSSYAESLLHALECADKRHIDKQ